MRRFIKIAAIILGSIVALLMLTGVSLYAVLQSDLLRDEAQTRLGAALGRETSIADTRIDWGWTTHVSLKEVKIANAEWGTKPHMLEAQSMDFQVEILPILLGDFVFPNIELMSPIIILERSAEGAKNWSFGENPAVATVAEVAAPDERSEAPTINKLVITKGKISFLDRQRDLALTGDIRIGAGEASGTNQVEFHATGKLEGKPLKVDFAGGSIRQLQESHKPYPLELSIDFGKTSVEVDGKIDDPFKMEGADLQMKLAGPDLAEIFPVLGVPAPSTPPYKLSGHLTRKGEVWQFQKMAGIVGNSDLAGDVKIDYVPERPFLTAKLMSKSLDFDDLGPLIGLPPGTDGKESASAQQEQSAAQLEADDELFPHVPLKIEKLRVMDMDVTLDAKTVRAPNYLPIQSLNGRVKVANGRAVLNPLKMGVANGIVQGEMVLNARQEQPTVSADLALSNLDLGAFFKGSPYFDTTDGKVHAQINLTGAGRSLAEVMGTGEGDIWLGMKGGSLSWLLVELAGLDIGQALILYVTEDAKVPIRCGAGRIVLNKGDAAFDRFIVDTTDSVLYVRGHANLRTQVIDMEIEADAKDFSLLDIDAPVALKGKIRNPDISIGKGVPIPLIEPGNAEDVSCAQLLGNLTTTPQN
ncbi:MAG: AsmA family protein [Rhodospirillaceae bacterium]|nr:AsmA family protein [Rhodospirillaceae bacterium]